MAGKVYLENKPLSGKKILVTRSRAQAGDFIQALEELGAEVVEFPTIKILPPEDFKALDDAIADLRRYNWIIFTSVNGVSFFMERFYHKGKDVRELKGIKIAAIGPATGRELKRWGLTTDYIPREYCAESIIEGFKGGEVEGTSILIPRAEKAREILSQGLRELGASVDVVTAYRTVIDDSHVSGVKQILSRGEIDIITFTSSSTVKNFVRLLEGIDLKSMLQKVMVACIGPITASTTQDLGLKVDVIAEEYTIEGLIKAILKKIHS
ncbi:MAG: uroporphyrinogen-III synthase [Actinomycetota bacterium]|nr:uroporphyrinogen-III synthase [Actinomycetota bacterium]